MPVNVNFIAFANRWKEGEQMLVHQRLDFQQKTHFLTSSLRLLIRAFTLTSNNILVSASQL